MHFIKAPTFFFRVRLRSIAQPQHTLLSQHNNKALSSTLHLPRHATTLVQQNYHNPPASFSSCILNFQSWSPCSRSSLNPIHAHIQQQEIKSVSLGLLSKPSSSAFFSTTPTTTSATPTPTNSPPLTPPSSSPVLKQFSPIFVSARGDTSTTSLLRPRDFVLYEANKRFHLVLYSVVALSQVAFWGFHAALGVELPSNELLIDTSWAYAGLAVSVLFCASLSFFSRRTIRKLTILDDNARTLRIDVYDFLGTKGPPRTALTTQIIPGKKGKNNDSTCSIRIMGDKTFYTIDMAYTIHDKLLFDSLIDGGGQKLLLALAERRDAAVAAAVVSNRKRTKHKKR